MISFLTLLHFQGLLKLFGKIIINIYAFLGKKMKNETFFSSDGFSRG